MPNELLPGRPRVGNLVDFDPTTPDVQVVLEKTSERIQLTVSWSGPSSPYASWFDVPRPLGNGSEYAEPLDRPAPRRLVFYDSHGTVMLIGCWPSAYHANLHGPGAGVLTAMAAVLDVTEDVDYERPHGLESEVSGLREWLGVSSWSEETSWDFDHLTATVTSEPLPPIEVGDFDSVSLELRPSWQIIPQRSSDQIVLVDTVGVRTRSSIPKPWKTHIAHHHALRDLLVLSRWRRESCVTKHASRLEDVLRTHDGEEHGPHWRKVSVPNEPHSEPRGGYQPHLIEFADLGVAGISQWIELRDTFGRALDPVISSIDLDLNAHTRLAHTGPGLEALGYLLMVRDGMAPSAASQVPLRQRLLRIWTDVATAAPVEGEAWAERMVATYNGLKHANRDLPPTVDLANAWREAVLVTRAWVALELGVSPADAAARLENDPQRRPFVART